VKFPAPWAAVVAVLALAPPLAADARTQKLLASLAEQAAAFTRIAPQLTARETLAQRAKSNKTPKARGRKEPPASSAPGWQSRRIVSQYGFAALGAPASIREIRKVVSVDGKAVNESGKALKDLMQSLGAASDKTQRKLLEDFEKHGLIGTVTDFGQIVLLFGGDAQAQYEFTLTGERLIGADRCVVFGYRQLEGTGALTVWDSKGRQQPRITGELWMERDRLSVARITLVSARAEGTEAVRDEAQVDYAPAHGIPVPAAVVHREYRNGQLVTENLFTYTAFERFGTAGVRK
jgi:hypothetical protein